ncbi:ACT domain-containing protein [Ideonella sp. YS5]|uniref:ACT domain-containing protein n=1 Tax=Ideonella sp. YS5 TaxID=3453714 RepID=UPI003EEBC284
MLGERDLNKLLQHMEPHVHSDVFVFCCFSDFRLPPALEPIGTFREAEGLTAIVPAQQARDLGLAHHFESAMVTLSVHSALDSVGFMAHISAALAEKGIACNVVSAFHHDHLFVPIGKVQGALEALRALAESNES